MRVLPKARYSTSLRTFIRVSRVFTSISKIFPLISDTGWWLQLAHTVDFTLQKEGFIVRHHVVLPDNSVSVDRLAVYLEPLHFSPCRGKYISLLSASLFLAYDTDFAVNALL
jgi:hypothetical protein